jgi:hypothetical protein
MVPDFLRWVNGGFFQGLGPLLKGYIQGRKEAKAFKQIIQYGPEEQEKD